MLSSELIFDQPITTSSGASRVAPRVAYNGSEYLVVWQDGRADGDGIFGTRVALDGTVLDPAGIAIAARPLLGFFPSVASDGSAFLVVWLSLDAGSLSVQARRVAADGTLDSDPVLIATVPTALTLPKVVFANGQYLVAWVQGIAGFSQVYAARVSVGGGVLDPNGFVVSLVTSSLLDVAVGGGGGQFLVAWRDAIAGTVVARRVDNTGSVLDPSGIGIVAGGTAPTIAFDGSQFLVAWRDLRNSTPDIFATRVSSAGVVLDPGGFGVVVSSSTQNSPAAGFDGTDFWVGWADDANDANDVQAVAITTAGVVHSLVLVSSAAGSQDNLALAAGDGRMLLVWHDTRNKITLDVYGARVVSGAVADPSGLLFTPSGNNETSPAVTFDGTEFALTWLDTRSGQQQELYQERLLPPDDLKGVQPLIQGAGLRTSPVFTWARDLGFVLWLDGGTLLGSPVTTAGSALAIPPLVFSAGPVTGVAAAPLLNNVLVVWCSGSPPQLYATRVTPAGTLLDSPPFQLAPTSAPQNAPSVATVGGSAWVVWSDSRSGAQEIFGLRVDTSGVILDPGGLAIHHGLQDTLPAVASDGETVLVAWQNGFPSGIIQGLRLDATGVQVSPSVETLSLSGPGLSASLPRVVFDGTNFVVGWHEGPANSQVDVRASRFSPTGVVQDAVPIDIAVGPEPERALAMASDGNGRTVFAYQSFDDSPAAQSWRLRAKVLGAAPTEETCMGNGACTNNSGPRLFGIGCGGCQATPGPFGWAMALVVLARLAGLTRNRS